MAERAGGRPGLLRRGLAPAQPGMLASDQYLDGQGVHPVRQCQAPVAQLVGRRPVGRVAVRHGLGVAVRVPGHLLHRAQDLRPGLPRDIRGDQQQPEQRLAAAAESRRDTIGQLIEDPRSHGVTIIACRSVRISRIPFGEHWYYGISEVQRPGRFAMTRRGQVDSCRWALRFGNVTRRDIPMFWRARAGRRAQVDGQPLHRSVVAALRMGCQRERRVGAEVLVKDTAWLLP